MIYRNICSKIKEGKKVFCVLIDPDKVQEQNLMKVITAIEVTSPDIILVGGSLVSKRTDDVFSLLKKNLSIPLILFPGNPMQVSPEADGILFLSLISGRNPELLIGHHVISAPLIKKTGMEVISTGYMLIESGSVTSVEYMSQTKPIPSDKVDIAVATAVAGEMLGQKLIYLEAGSGANIPVPNEIIGAVKKNIDIPLIVGGGLNTVKKIKQACEAGADIIVVGNAIEKDLSLLEEFREVVRSYE